MSGKGVAFAMRQSGVVRWFSAPKGYGFIALDASPAGKDLFVHYSAIDSPGFKTLEEGDRVECEIEQGAKGPQAARVRVVA